MTEKEIQALELLKSMPIELHLAGLSHAIKQYVTDKSPENRQELENGLACVGMILHFENLTAQEIDKEIRYVHEAVEFRKLKEEVGGK